MPGVLCAPLASRIPGPDYVWWRRSWVEAQKVSRGEVFERRSDDARDRLTHLAGLTRGGVERKALELCVRERRPPLALAVV